ncbi:MAG: LysR substrate-binding domain-containing protein [Myxococcales bacterium]
MGDLAMHTVDVVLADAPAPADATVRAFSHPLGECGSVVLAAPELAKSLRRNFPDSLEGAPLLVPGADSTLRRALNAWFDSRDMRPEIVAELDDAALATILGEAELGAFVAPEVVEKEIRRRYKVQLVGRRPCLKQSLLRDLDRPQDQASGRHGDLRSGAQAHLRVISVGQSAWSDRTKNSLPFASSVGRRFLRTL